MDRPPRLFTYEEATALMPRVVEIVRHLQELKQQLDDAIGQYAQLTPAMRTNGYAQRAAGLEAVIRDHQDALRSTLLTLTELGVELKDIDMGLVDFPAVRDGRVVYLCWKIDEPSIAFWHELDTGFAGRQPL